MRSSRRRCCWPRGWRACRESWPTPARLQACGSTLRWSAAARRSCAQPRWRPSISACRRATCGRRRSVCSRRLLACCSSPRRWRQSTPASCSPSAQPARLSCWPNAPCACDGGRPSCGPRSRSWRRPWRPRQCSCRRRRCCSAASRSRGRSSILPPCRQWRSSSRGMTVVACHAWWPAMADSPAESSSPPRGCSCAAPIPGLGARLASRVPAPSGSPQAPMRRRGSSRSARRPGTGCRAAGDGARGWPGRARPARRPCGSSRTRGRGGRPGARTDGST
jgi:hypothetical protein